VLTHNTLGDRLAALASLRLPFNVIPFFEPCEESLEGAWQFIETIRPDELPGLAASLSAGFRGIDPVAQERQFYSRTKFLFAILARILVDGGRL